MKTIILCGGQGTRMKEETEFKPKPMVNVGGRPFLWHIMKLYAHQGHKDFILALGYKGNMIKDYFLNRRAFHDNFTLNTKTGELSYHSDDADDFNITFVDTGLNSLTGERVRRLKDFIDDDNFMLTYGDGVADIDINKLIDFHKKQNTVGTITGVHPLTRFGMVSKDEETNKITEFIPKTYLNDYVNGGFMVFKKEFIDMIDKDSMVETAFDPLAQNGQLSLYHHTGKWKCMDTHKEVEEINEYYEKDPFWKIWN